jgi:hypothetical protein
MNLTRLEYLALNSPSNKTKASPSSAQKSMEPMAFAKLLTKVLIVGTLNPFLGRSPYHPT